MRPKSLFIIVLLVSILSIVRSENQNYRSSVASSTSNPVRFLDTWEVSLNDEQEAEPAIIPGVFPSNAAKVLLKTGFEIPDSLNNLNLEIHFNGIQGYARISLNKNLIITHPDYPSPFTVRIPADWVKSSGKNFLEILISPPDSESEGFPQYAHIFQPAKPLAVTGEIYIVWLKDIHYSKFNYTYNAKSLNINYNLNIDISDTLGNGKYSKLRFEEKLTTLSGDPISSRFEYINFRKQTKKIARSIALRNPRLWSPESPDLYKIRLSVHAGGKQIASLAKIIGLRTLQVKRGVIYLNSQPIQIKGITYRTATENIPVTLLQMEKDLNTIKALGFNAIRIPNSMHHPDMAVLTDSIGLFFSYENGLWRVPEAAFVKDNFMQMSKVISSEIASSVNNHPSLLSIGLGNEIALHEPSVQKFILILSKFLKQNYQVLTHVAPIDYSRLPSTDLTDIYLINSYHDAVFSAINYMQNNYSTSSPAIILGNIGFPAGHDSVGEKYAKLSGRINTSKIIRGFFIESFRDWPAQTNSFIVNSDGFYPYGLFTSTGEKRAHIDVVKKLLAGENQAVYYQNSKSEDKTNLFSLSVFITSIIFFLVYRQNFRLRDNIKRSLAHSYGFFVDLRDRRIIALLNSFIIGLFTNLLVANILAAYLYYFRDSIYIEEMMNAMLSPFGLNNFYINLIQTPFLLLLVIWSFFFMGQILIASLLKLLSIFSEEKIRFKQTVAVCNWAGVPLLFLIPVSLISYKLILPASNLHIFLFLTMILFSLWYNFRLATGIRVLMIKQAFTVFSILLLTYGIVFFTFIAFLESKSDFFGYINLLTQGKILFY